MPMDTKLTKPSKRKSPAWIWWTRYGWPVVRHLIIPAVCILALLVGMAAGYTVLGDRPLSEVWEIETWKHMFDLIFSET